MMPKESAKCQQATLVAEISGRHFVAYGLPVANLLLS